MISKSLHNSYKMLKQKAWCVHQFHMRAECVHKNACIICNCVRITLLTACGNVTLMSFFYDDCVKKCIALKHSSIILRAELFRAWDILKNQWRYFARKSSVFACRLGRPMRKLGKISIGIFSIVHANIRD